MMFFIFYKATVKKIICFYNIYAHKEFRDLTPTFIKFLHRHAGVMDGRKLESFGGVA